MYDLATIHRLNDAAALKEQFPDHDCAEEFTFSDRYDNEREEWERMVEERSDRDDIKHDLDVVRGIVDDLVRRLLHQDTITLTVWDRNDIEHALNGLYT